MTLTDPRTDALPATRAATLSDRLTDAGVRFAIAGYTDLHGNLKGKMVPVSHTEQMAAGSELFTGAALDGLPQEVNEEELSAVPDLDRGVILPWRRDVAMYLSELRVGGEPFEASTRNVLARQVAAAAELGLTFNLGVETEFFVLREGTTPTDNVSDRDVLDKPCYTIPALLDNLDWVGELVDHMNELGWDVYSFDHEDAQGQFEIDFAYADGMTMADRVVLFRTMAGEVARRHGAYATFMPKPFADRSGSGAHFNMSLADVAGANLFESDDDPRGAGLSELGYHFAAGIVKHAAAICAVIAPTVNSYKRLVRQGSMSGSTWAPIFASAGNNNRTNMLRIPLGGGRVECRAVDSACNPHLAAAMLLAAGLEGVREKAELASFHTENLHAIDPSEYAERGLVVLPRTLEEAVDAFEADPLAAQVCGDALHASFIEYKRDEWASYTTAVTDWEMNRYLRFF
ncbi:type III glutamate--ammonia ligase [Litorihabitans aurantiacus]|uniref:Type III glutamate--ammonia ligase n=1 Tax=Litorihabitans aurantiacus TaxID=1930061 RepID=A0AA38CTJ0_9MICO|nr:type III glutamate--ammonia ligase [Litorihabitans aurantiacus]GMA32831.1 type III glutamate--ammonia ligase [Litorihabitans aurantiacus]